MFKKLKVPCPNCKAYKLFSWSPAGLSLGITVTALIFACVPIIGWLFLVPILFAEIILIPTTIVLYLIPKMRVVTARCRQCEWKSTEQPFLLKPQT